MLSHTAGAPEPPRQGRTFSSTKFRRAQDAGWKKPCAYPLRRYRGDRHRALLITGTRMLRNALKGGYSALAAFAPAIRP